MIWRGLDAWRADAAHVQLEAGRLSARGTQFCAGPYRLDYRLRTGPDLITETLELSLVDPSFEAVLEFDDDGLVVRYPDLAERI